MSVRIETSRFEFSHNKKPAGFGYWFFETRTGEHFFRFTGLYSEAKKQAVKAAKAVSNPVLYVSP